MSGQIIIVNGSSGAGKTTTCQTFVQRSDEMYLHFGIDNLMGALFPPKFSIFGDRTEDGVFTCPEGPVANQRVRWNFGSAGWRAVVAFHEMIAACARAGQSVILDHLATIDPPVLQDCALRFAGLPVLLVAVKPPREILEDRIAIRSASEGAVPPGLSEAAGVDGAMIADRLRALNAWFYDAVYANDCHDLVVNTNENTPEQVCEMIERRLAEGPGTAFDILRQRFGS